MFFAHPDSDVYFIPFVPQPLCSPSLSVALVAQQGSIKTCMDVNYIAGALVCFTLMFGGHLLHLVLLLGS